MMRTRFTFLFVTISVLSISNAAGQQQKEWVQSIGVNLLQIPATTIDLSCELSNNHKYTIVGNAGYTINYANSFDFIGFLMSPHYKCANDGYVIKNQSGGFVKAGVKYNFRKSLQRRNFFYLGAFIDNSLIKENAEFYDYNNPESEVEYLNHKVFILGLTGAAGFNFAIANKLSADFGVHISVPSANYKKLYGYSNYIPGMGYMETCGNEKFFPMLVLNLKYKLK